MNHRAFLSPKVPLPLARLLSCLVLSALAHAAPPVITNVAASLGVANQPFAFQVEATGTPTAYTASGLPPGLDIDAVSGLISGTPTATGVRTVTLTATNADGTATATHQLTIGTVKVYASGAPLNYPIGLAFDARGDLLVGNLYGNSISRITPQGQVSTFASGLDAPATPCFDREGRLFVTCPGNDQLVRLSPVGAPTVIASGPGLDGLIGTALDPSGTLTLGCVWANRVVKVSPEGAVTPVLFLDRPAGVAYDRAGNLYVAKAWAYEIVRLTPGGSLTTFAAGLTGGIDAIAFDQAGTLYVPNYESGAVSTVSPSGLIQVLATGFSGPRGVTFDRAGTLYFSDSTANTIYQIGFTPPVITSAASTLAVLSTPFTYGIEATGFPSSYGATGLPTGLSVNPTTGVISGTPTQVGRFTVTLSATNDDGTTTRPLTLDVGTVTPYFSSPLLDRPTGLGFDPAGNLVIANDAHGYDGDGRVVSLSPTGVLRTLATGFGDIMGFAFSAAGDLYAADYYLGKIRRITPAGSDTVFASGLGVPHGVAFDRAGNLYYSNRVVGDFKVGRITPAGVVSTFASGPAFSSPGGLAFDASGDLFVANLGSSTVARVYPTGDAATFASSLSNCWGLAFDAAGTLLVSEYTAGRISRITPRGSVTTLAAGFSGPLGLAFDAAGALYVVNGVGGTISRIGLPPPVISRVSAIPSTLWPPNGAMIPVTLQVTASGTVEPVTCRIVSVTSSEADSGLFPGDRPGDIVTTGPLTVELRAERFGGGDGRTYTVTVEAKDAAGHASYGTVTVTVPKAPGKPK